MKRLKILFLLPLSILSQNLVAQVDDLLKDKNVTWAAEIYVVPKILRGGILITFSILCEKTD
jgi:hypothetical protein